MREPDAPDPAFEEIEEALLLDLDGYEGPLHVLLALAQTRKVDLARLSVAQLADQFLAFVEAARARRIALAGDYLVMAAWLTYLKSRLLLPKPVETVDQPDPESLEAALRAKLVRLAQVRALAAGLDALPQWERDLFGVGAPQSVRITRAPVWRDDLFDLMKAYGAQASKAVRRARYAAKPRRAYPLEDARKRLEQLSAELSEWRSIDALAPAPLETGEAAPPPTSYLASVFGAALELVRDGRLEARQQGAFAPLYLRARREKP